MFSCALTYIKWNIWYFVLMYVNSCLELCSVRFGCRLFSLWMPSSSAYLWDNNNIMFLCARANVCYNFIFLGFYLIFTWKWFFSAFNGIPRLFAKIGESSLKIPVNCLWVLNNRVKTNFFLEIFGGMENCLYFCTRFWEIQLLLAIKKVSASRIQWNLFQLLSAA